MQNDLHHQIRGLLAAYLDIPAGDFQMEAGLESGYDMDSSEITEFAKTLEQRFGITTLKTERSDWNTGNDICCFVESRLSANRRAA
jgi:acyl carrier protein